MNTRIAPARSGRRVVLHADDFGLNPAVNRGILSGFAYGLLTSTSILANAPAFTEALEGWRELLHEQELHRLPSQAIRARLGEPALPFDLGVHLNLTQGRPLTGSRFPRQLLDTRGRFPGVVGLLTRLIVTGRRYRTAIRDELAAQIERLLEHGVSPTHLNGHQYVEMLPVVADLIPDLAMQYRITTVRVGWEKNLTRSTIFHGFRPLSWSLAQVKRLFAFNFLLKVNRCRIRHPAAYFGTAHAGRIDLPLLQQFIESSGEGLTEIGMHPGILCTPDLAGGIADGWSDPLASLRPLELKCVTSPSLADILSNQHVDLSRLAGNFTAQPRRIAA